MSHRTIAAACAFALAATIGAAHSKTFVYCSEGSPEGFSPMLFTSGTTFDANRPIYDRLVNFKPGTTEVQPMLAESFDASEDGTTFTFHLRHNVKWQSNANFKPTHDFNADDVLFTFERQWKDSNPYHKIGTFEYFSDMSMPKLLKSIEKVDDYTIKMTLNIPNAPFLSDMAMDFSSIMSKEYADTLMKMGKPELLDQDPIGTGAFELQQYQKDATIRYRAFAGYWGPKPKIDVLVFAITKDPAVRLAKLRANECQMAPFPAPADLPSIKADTSLKVMSQPGLNIGYLAMNVEHKPFDNRDVRVAVNMAIDKKAILDAVYQGSGIPATNLIPPTMWSYNKSVEDYKYDPDAAKKLLAQAGYPNGFETTLWAMPVQRPYNPDARRIGEMMQADLAKIGVNAKLVTYEWGEYRKRAQNGEDITAQLGWTGDNGDPDNFFFLDGCTDNKPASNNIPKWCNAEFNDLLVKARVISDQGERAKLYQRMQEIEHEEAPEFLIAHSTVFESMRANVTGYKQSPLGTHTFEGVDVQ